MGFEVLLVLALGTGASALAVGAWLALRLSAEQRFLLTLASHEGLEVTAAAHGNLSRPLALALLAEGRAVSCEAVVRMDLPLWQVRISAPVALAEPLVIVTRGHEAWARAARDLPLVEVASLSSRVAVFGADGPGSLALLARPAMADAVSRALLDDDPRGQLVVASDGVFLEKPRDPQLSSEEAVRIVARASAVVSALVGAVDGAAPLALRDAPHEAVASPSASPLAFPLPLPTRGRG